ncbi:MAG: NTP transferase domain-containing protein [Planctomycetota bacterium]
MTSTGSTSGIVLCGGRSSRMGRPKARLPWRGQTMIEHVVEVLHQVTEEVVVITSAELDLPSLDARVVRDREPALGPLAGIREGLEAVSAELAYVTSTDAPFLSPAFVEKMLSFGVAAAPEVDGFVQSLAAVYPSSLADQAGQLIAAHRLRPLFLLEAAGYRKVGPEELPDLDSLRNFNTAAEYLQGVRSSGTKAPALVEFLGTVHRKAGVDTMEAEAGHLRDVLRHVEESLPALQLLENGDPAKHILISLDGRIFLSDGNIAIGPGDRVLVMDAEAGG